jgi:hypothetical protein
MERPSFFLAKVYEIIHFDLLKGAKDLPTPYPPADVPQYGIFSAAGIKNR